MIIKITKLHIFLLSSLLIAISFIFALKEETVVRSSSIIESRKIPIIMYHHITTEPRKTNTYTVLVDELEADIKYITSKGYTTITVEDLINYVNGEIDLPEKCIMITFDDGFASFYTYAYPLLKQYKIKTVLSVIGYTADLYSMIDDNNVDYANLTWQQIKELNDSGLVEIGNHTYNLHDNTKGKRKGMAKNSAENNDMYRNVITTDLLRLQDLFLNHIGKKAKIIAYPYGAYSKNTTEIIKSLGFSASLTCESRINVISKYNTECLYNLGRYNRPSGKATEAFFKEII